jgi:hypothetical protein
MFFEEEVTELVVKFRLLLLARTDPGLPGLPWGEGVRSAGGSWAGAKKLLAIDQAFLECHTPTKGTSILGTKELGVSVARSAGIMMATTESARSVRLNMPEPQSEKPATLSAGRPKRKATENAATGRIVKLPAASKPTKPPASGKEPMLEIGEEVYEVEKLIDRRIQRGSTQYLVRWSGFGPEDDTWEAKSNILDTSLIRDFEKHASEVVARWDNGDAEVHSGATGGAADLDLDVSCPTTLRMTSPSRSTHEAGTPGSGRFFLQAHAARHGMLKVGSAYQATIPPEPVPTAPLVLPAPAPAPHCRCRRPALWAFERWWCDQYKQPPGCTFEHLPSLIPPPLCTCNQPATLIRSRWCCAAGDDGCAFELPMEEERSELLHPARLHADACAGTAAILSAAAHGPLNGFLFVAPAREELGVFARQKIRAGQAVGELGGPRLPVSPFLRHTDRALVIPASGANEPVFIDTSGANSPFHVPWLHPASMVGCAGNPNARIEKVTVADAGLTDLGERMWLVATEDIDAGAELRVDPKAFDGGFRGPRPRDDSWRLVRLRPPPSSGQEPMFGGLGSLGAGSSKPPPPATESPLEERAEGHAFSDDEDQYATPSPYAPLRWEGPGGGDERLLALLPKLSKLGIHKFALVATHLHGRSGVDCRDRWQHLQKLKLQARKPKR